MNNIKPIAKGSIKKGDRKAVIVKTGDMAYTVEMYLGKARIACVYSPTLELAASQAQEWALAGGNA